MPHTFAPADAVELAVVERSGFIESRHVGVAVVLGPDGQTLRSLGNIDALILPRSSMKPMQALACLTAGANLEGAQLGMATASHSGTDAHVTVVRDILDAAGLDERDLACPAAWPTDSFTRDSMVRAEQPPSPLRMNCSGKHAAMLLACKANGWNTEGYLDPSHPLQLHIREVVERLTGARAGNPAIDGCGAPVYAMSVLALARAIQRIGISSEKSPFALHRSAGALVRAVRENPWTVDGPGRPDTIAAEKLGVFSKLGAEGVQVMVAPDGTTVALKVLDGSGRAASVTALTLLVKAGALPAANVARALSELPLTIVGGGQTVGAIRPTV